ncbi:MAG: small multi-drug export protein [Sphaerochaetaceae bacterium]
MELKNFLFCILLSLAPISELRGGIPYGFFHDIPLTIIAPFCIVANALVGPVAYIFLATFHKIFYRNTWYKNTFDRFVLKARNKIAPKVTKYGYWGLLLFVAVPLPVTGAWTGILGSWILGLEKRKTILAITGGVIISGLIVSILLTCGVGLNSVFIKRI